MPTLPHDAAQAASLVDLMRWRALTHPARELFVLLKDGETPTQRLTFGEVDRRARALAVGLMERAAPGERVLLLYPSSLEYPVAFLACLYAGLVAVPAYPPDPSRMRQTLPRINRIVNDADARIILSTAGLAETAELARSQAADPAHIVCLSSDKAKDAWADDWAPRGVGDGEGRERLAFLQYTSGSTGDPRGVMVSHRNLIDHQRHAHGVFQAPDGATTVSWLPFYHDMGLIGAMLYPLYVGGRCVLMPPASFVRRPLRWLEAITTFGADTSTGPNFAYELCVQRVRDEDMARLDLSSWRLTVCGAEPLRAHTLDRFARTFAPAGFRRRTFLPCHGMAEATLMVTGGRWEREPPITWFCDDGLDERRARVVPPGSDRAQAHVACGRPADAHEIRIVDPDTRRPCDDDEVGEIWVRGPSVAAGYWNLPEVSLERFAATLSTAGGVAANGPDATSEGSPTSECARWFRTDDLGFVHEGELYVMGRLTDLIRDGRHWRYPHVVERPLEKLPGIDGDVVAVPALTPPEDDALPLVVMAEIKRRRTDDERRALREAIIERVSARYGRPPADVVLIVPRAVPKTTSGKVRRHAWRALLRELANTGGAGDATDAAAGVAR